MQTKGGGKHDILSVAPATATALECLWMMPRDPDADMCRGTTMPMSTQECMAHQSGDPSPARPPTSPRRGVRPIGIACRQGPEPKDRGCMIGAISNWLISKSRN
jgi:hypothetical protein